jgi:hypothetical protein
VSLKGSISKAVLAAVLAALPLAAAAQQIAVAGRVLDPDGNTLPAALVRLDRQSRAVAQSVSGPDGAFAMTADAPGDFTLTVEAQGFRPVSQAVYLSSAGAPAVEVRFKDLSTDVEQVTVTADINSDDVLSPDPAERVFVRQELLDANPGRPGAPVSIPGYPVESASSGIKAPQYFAPGVAGDHGEPIAQYIAVGTYLVSNNLSANAHGNGYADPNLFIPQTLESVQVDGGAFNVRRGNHAVNLASTYSPLSRLDPFLTVTGDPRDLDVALGLSPSKGGWIAFEAGFGNGFLQRSEHRQQYKFNGQQRFSLGNHEITLFGAGYYGSSYIPGLAPIPGLNPGSSMPDYGDTIDPRQKDQTHTALIAANDIWQITSGQQLQISGLFRTYNLALYSNFGDGLIRQSEFRTVTGGNSTYINKLTESLTLMAGVDYLRDAPRRDNLDRYGAFDHTVPGYYGPFTPVTSNNVTIGSVSPYLALQGALGRRIHYYAGWRRDEINFNNQDLLAAQKSFQNWTGVNSPKATISLAPGQAWFAPLLSLSYGEAFYTNDPRIGSAAAANSHVSTAHSYQLVASKTLRRTDIRLTLGHVTTSGTLAKLDPDTGLPYDEGPGRMRFMSFALRQTFKYGSVFATFSKADARDLSSGAPTPEAPRTIFDLLGAWQRLAFRLQARGEFEYVGAKPLGTGCAPAPASQCTGVPVRELRGALVRPLLHGRMDAGVNFLIASGYTGQTTEGFAPSPLQQIVGVRVPSYASLSLTYRFGH